MYKLINKVLVLTSVFLFFGFTANAAPYYGAWVSSDVWTNVSSDLSGVRVTGNGAGYLGQTADAILTNETYRDLRQADPQYDPVSTIVTYSGEAKSSSTGLQSKVSGKQFSEILIPSETDEIQSGWGEFSVNAYAIFSDTLSIFGANDLSSIQFSVNVHGTRGDALFGSFIQVDGSGLSFHSNDSIWDGINDFNLTLYSGVLDINNGQVFIRMNLLTTLGFNFGGEAGMTMQPEYQDVLRSVDFFNTVTIGQFVGFNESGDVVDLSSVVGSDGQSYKTLRVASAPVPEPATLLLFGTGLVGLIGGARRKKKGSSAESVG